MIQKALETVSLVSKTLILSLVAVAILCAVFAFAIPTSLFESNHGHAPLPAMSKARLASHYILMKEGHRNTGICTGTAIGAHAILSATHCDDFGFVTAIALDYSVEEHHVVRRIDDGRDHIIWLIDGAPLTNTVSVVQGAPVSGASVTIYGVGGGAYPPVKKSGRTVPCEDPSDVDADAGMQCFTLLAIGGDSGSAIYNFAEDTVVGIVTYKDNGTKPSGAIGFALNFTPAQLADAATFNGKALPPPPAPKMLPFFPTGGLWH